MDTSIAKHHEILAASVIKNLEKRQMEGYYCPTAKEAIEKALSFLPENASVGFGGSATLAETGMLDALRVCPSIRLFDRDAVPADEKDALYHKCLSADAYFMSSNAITKDGELVNIDGTGNRVAALIYGPKEVIILAGMNKIAPTLQDALDRIHNTATPPNCIRLNKKTPCAATGSCAHCLSPDCICNQVVITRRSGIKGRIKVLLIGGTFGF